MVKSSSPMSRPGVEAGTSTYWSLPLNRTAEPTRPGTCKGRNSGSSKVNQADRPAGTGAQWGWAQRGRPRTANPAHQQSSIHQREFDVVNGSVILNREIQGCDLLSHLGALHIEHKLPPDREGQQTL